MITLIPVILLAIFALSESLPVTITGVKCIPNKKFCGEHYCYLKTIRKRISVVDFQCVFSEIQSAFFTARLHKKNGNKYEIFFFDTSGNLCDVVSHSAQSPLLSRLFPSILKSGFNITSCPFKGLVRVDGYSLDLSFFPSVIPQGEFKMEFNIFDGAQNETIFLSFLTFLIKY